MPLILPGNVATATASTTYDVANSCRFDRGSSASMHITFSSAGDRQKFTFSFWIKRNKLGTQEVIFDTNFGGGASEHRILFDSSDRLEYYDYASSSTTLKYVTNRVFRDTTAWYSIIIAVDTTQGTAGNRVKIYINGTQETSFGTETQPSENLSTSLNTAVKHQIGTKNVGANYLDAYLAEFVFIDGTQYANTDFGEFDSDSPRIWKPKDPSGLTFGTNGFYLDFEASDNLGNDANGGTDLTEVNLAATDQATDTCTNNFATLNNLFPEANVAYSEGNLKVTADGSANWSSVIGTIGLTAGKWYWEWTATSSSNAFAGIVSEALVNSTLISDATPYDQNGLILYFTDGRKTVDGTSTESHFTAWSSGTMSFALDLDSGTRTIKMYHNGSQTGDTINLTANFASGASVFPVFMVNAGSNTSLQNINFGSPPYANSSDAADENGYGAFEFAPPSGYLAICTKNLGSDGG